jgi:hypothetical protein
MYMNELSQVKVMLNLFQHLKNRSRNKFGMTVLRPHADYTNSTVPLQRNVAVLALRCADLLCAQQA